MRGGGTATSRYTKIVIDIKIHSFEYEKEKQT